MANKFYNKGLEGFASAEIDWVDDTIRAFLVDSANYTPDMANHDYLDDIPTNARFGNSGSSTRGNAPALSSKTLTNGILDAANTVFTSMTPAATVCEYLVIFKDDGVADSSSRLICLIDTMTGLPVTFNGANITISWNDGTDKIAKLGEPS